MIHKVSKNSEWLETQDSIKRDSVSKFALTSFSNIIVKKAKDMKSKGQSYEQISQHFGLPETVLKSMIAEAHEVESQVQSCPCMEKEASVDESSVNSAQAAYDTMYGKKLEIPTEKIEAGKRIVSGQTSDNGGYHRQMGTVSQPTIFDPDKISRTISEMDNGERIRKENERIESRRASLHKEYHTIDGKDLKTALQETIQSKVSSVSSVSGQEAHKYSKKMPVNGMSIFDKDEFERLTPTDGEKMLEAHKKEDSEKKADRSWTENGRKTVSTKDIAKSMIDSMLKE